MTGTVSARRNASAPLLATATLKKCIHLKIASSSMRLFICAVALYTWVLGQHCSANTPTLIGTAPQTGGPGITLVQMYPNHEHPVPGPCIAQLGDTVEIRVDRLTEWLAGLKTKHVITSDKNGDDLVVEQVPRFCLFINNQPMRTLQASGWLKDDSTWPGHEKMSEAEKSTERWWVRFPLTRDGSNGPNRADWSEVLMTPGLESQMDLTLGYYHADSNTAETLASWVQRDSKDPDKQLSFAGWVWMSGRFGV